MLHIICKNTYKAEREYICNVIFREFLGLQYRLDFHGKDSWRISLEGEKKEIVLPDVFFQTPYRDWLTKRNMPSQPLKIWHLHGWKLNLPVCEGAIPVVYGDMARSDCVVPLDIFGSAFFMLTRYEEIVKDGRDALGRFPANASLGFQEGFLDRPLVNEYLEVLWFCLKRFWPGLRRSTREFRILPSHDIDVPLKYRCRPKRDIAKAMVAEIKGCRSAGRIVNKIVKWKQILKGNVGDPFDTFGWLMDQSEKYGWTSAFYLKGNTVRRQLDSTYKLECPALRRIIKEIIRRKHQIGFHAGYYTYLDQELWFKELENVRKHLPGVEIQGGRQHYLRFRIPFTWRLWERGRLEYDASLCFADHAGFRCGTCYEFPVYDLIARRRLNLRERPLVLMDKTLMDSEYMGLGLEAATKYVNVLKERVKSYRGDFSFLWHNNFLSLQNKKLYAALL